MSEITIIDTDAGNIQEYGICGYKNLKQEGFRRKVAWMKKRFAEGMKYKILNASDEGAVGAIEYIPGEYAWRPVNAAGYMFIHCIFILKRKYKSAGYGSLLLAESLEDARGGDMHGVAVVTRKGTWMAGKDLFVKNGFQVIDTAPPDFNLLVKKFNEDAPDPTFSGNWADKVAKYQKGMFMLTTDQCPYVDKAVRDIGAVAKSDYGMDITFIEYKNSQEVHESPCPFGTFCLIYNSEIIADHPISKTRIEKIMKKLGAEFIS